MRRLGLPSDVYGLSTDSKVIDAQFGFERAIGALIAATARPAFVSGMGFMQTGVGGSLEALVIDDEILRYIAWSLEERPADAAAMDVDAVKQAVSTSAGFLGLRQTRSYLRTESVQRQLAHSGALSLRGVARRRPRPAGSRPRRRGRGARPAAGGARRGRHRRRLRLAGRDRRAHGRGSARPPRDPRGLPRPEPGGRRVGRRKRRVGWRAYSSSGVASGCSRSRSAAGWSWLASPPPALRSA